ncbi:MAG: thiamine phosphate synthase [Syntrophomonadaceae bacterium]
MKTDYTLYLVTDRRFLRGRSLIDEVLKSVRGGVSMVQLREKEAGSREFYQMALNLKTALQESGVPLIINDRLDIAMAVDADGLHIGQEDLPLSEVVRLWGEDKIIGLSVSNLEEAREGQKGGASYLGLGPVYATATKTDAAGPTGLMLLGEVKSSVDIPVVAIGGIDMSNLAAVRDSGADGAAVVSCLMDAPDIEKSAREMVKLWKNRW